MFIRINFCTYHQRRQRRCHCLQRRCDCPQGAGYMCHKYVLPAQAQTSPMRLPAAPMQLPATRKLHVSVLLSALPVLHVSVLLLLLVVVVVLYRIYIYIYICIYSCRPPGCRRKNLKRSSVVVLIMIKLIMEIMMIIIIMIQKITIIIIIIIYVPRTFSSMHASGWF